MERLCLGVEEEEEEKEERERKGKGKKSSKKKPGGVIGCMKLGEHYKHEYGQSSTKGKEGKKGKKKVKKNKFSANERTPVPNFEYTLTGVICHRGDTVQLLVGLVKC